MTLRALPRSGTSRAVCIPCHRRETCTKDVHSKDSGQPISIGGEQRHISGVLVTGKTMQRFHGHTKRPVAPPTQLLYEKNVWGMLHLGDNLLLARW